MRHAGLACALLLALSRGATASTYLVLPDGSGDTPSIAAALRLAVSGDVIELGDGVFSGLGSTALDFAGRTLTLRSRSGDPTACVLDAAAGPAAPARLLSLVSGEGVATRIEGIGFRGGYLADADGGALLLAGSDVRIVNCRFSGNAAREGGAVFVAGGAPVFEDCVFIGNTGGNAGGGLGVSGGAVVTVTRCRFAANSADYGGGLMADAATLALADCVFLGNSASARGGGVYAGDRAALALTGCTLAYNGSVAGGGLALATLSSLTLAQSIVAFAPAGGAIELRFGSAATISCSDLFGNAGGDWTGALAAQLGTAGNLALDPEFCGDAVDGDLTLAAGSPCAAPACGAMGAEGVGCTGRSVGAMDFSTLKQLYGN
ncbi:hypothetical protein FJ251_12705 [bacterium]|nr:hypothetical protein [bacterium]